jgi:multidrug transporter EmrE-like cation transporter
MSYQDLIPLIFTEIVGDFGFKEFANYGGLTNFTIGLTGYIGVIYYLIRSLQGSNILLVNAVWDALSAFIESLAAIIILGEKFHDPSKYFGIILIIAGLYFLKMPLFRKHTFKFPDLIKESFIT